CLTYLSGARWRVGYHAFGGEASYRGDLMTHRLSFNPYLHTSQTFQMMVDALDHDATRFPAFSHVPQTDGDANRQSGEPHFVPTSDEIGAVQSLLQREGVFSRRLVLLNANASDLMPLRRWPSDRYVELARRLLDEDAELAIAFTGAPAESDAVEKLV